MTTSTQNPWSLSQLHLLLTGECNFECDHCFVWGGPEQGNTMTAETIRMILEQASGLGSIEWIYFEGGEPFLYYPLLLESVQQAHGQGFKVGIVTNAQWASDEPKALTLLKPFAGLVQDLSISDDSYHGAKEGPSETTIARGVAKKLGIPVDFISIAKPGETDTEVAQGQIPAGKSSVVYRGRAAEKLAALVEARSWDQYTTCPWEDLRQPERVHVDSLGNMHICQGISIGNLLDRPLLEIMQGYDPQAHPIIGPLLTGGPAELVESYALPHLQAYADACHLCYESRNALRTRFPDELALDQMYGV